MSKTLHRSQIRCMLLSVIEVYDRKISSEGPDEGCTPEGIEKINSPATGRIRAHDLFVMWRVFYRLATTAAS